MKIFKGYVRDWNLSDWEAKRSTSALPTDPRSGIPSDGSTSIPPGLSFCLDRKSAARFSIPRNVNRPQREELILGPKEKMARKPVQGARPWTSLTVYVGHNRHIVHPDYDMIPPRERGENTSKPGRQPWDPGSLYAREELFLPLPARRSAFEDRAQPVIDASVVIIWRRWIAPILTPLCGVT